MSGLTVDAFSTKVDDITYQQKSLDLLAFASLVETSTLAALVFIAVPLKHYANLPAAVSWIGPVHGLAFIVYVWLLSTIAHDPIWTRREIVRLFISAVIPLSGFFNIGLFRRKKATLLSGTVR